MLQEELLKHIMYIPIQLAKRNELLTHHADKNVLSLMKVKDILETNFVPINKDATWGDLINAVSHSERNIFPIVDEKNNLGVVTLNDIRHIMFNQKDYDKVPSVIYCMYPEPMYFKRFYGRCCTQIQIQDGLIL